MNEKVKNSERSGFPAWVVIGLALLIIVGPTLLKEAGVFGPDPKTVHEAPPGLTPEEIQAIDQKAQRNLEIIMTNRDRRETESARQESLESQPEYREGYQDGYEAGVEAEATAPESEPEFEPGEQRFGDM